MEDFQHVGYTKEVIEFVAVSKEFCDFVETAPQMTREAFVERLQKFIPLIYLKGSLLPRSDEEGNELIEDFVTEENYNYLYGNPKVHYLNECLYTHIINSDSVMFKFNTSKTFNFEYLKVIDAFDRMLQMESQITRNYKSYVLYSYYNYIQHILSKMAVCDNVSHDEYEQIRILSQNIKNKIPFTLQILLILKQIKTLGR